MTQIDELLGGQGQVATRDQLIALIGRTRMDGEVRCGQLTRVFPRVYARPWDVDQPDIRLRAGLACVGGQVALSHLSAIGTYQLPVPEDRLVHVTAYQPRHPRGVPGKLIVHRTKLRLDPRWVNETPVVAPEIALVTSWPMMAGDAQRAPLIEASRRRLIRPDVLSQHVEDMYWIRGRRGLRDLCALVLAGCESELELWGYLHVFDIEPLRNGVRQRVVNVGDRTFRLDLAFDDVQVAVELDGRAFHASPAQWERDIARDLILAMAGWQTIRLSHARLHTDPDGCRRDVLDVLAARRRRAS
jgi:very-short-patch-repair endonuclease